MKPRLPPATVHALVGTIDTKADVVLPIPSEGLTRFRQQIYYTARARGLVAHVKKVPGSTTHVVARFTRDRRG